MKHLMFVLAGFAAAASGQDIGFRTVAMSGEPAPGTPQGAEFLGFSAPVINAYGRVAFGADVVGAGIDIASRSGVWSDGRGGLGLVYRAGEPTPGIPGTTLSAVKQAPFLNDHGDCTLWAQFRDPTQGLLDGVWSQESFGLELLFAEGQPLDPNSPDVLFSAVSSVLVNESGEAAAIANLIGTGITLETDQVVVRSIDGVPQVIARQGDTPPGRAAPDVFFSFDSFSFTDAGAVAFSSVVISSRPASGVWLDAGDGLELIASTGQGLPGNRVVQSTQRVRANNAGEALVYAQVQDGMGVARASLWRFGPSGVHRVVGIGDAVPQAAPDATISQITWPGSGQIGFAISGDGHSAYRCSIDRPGDVARSAFVSEQGGTRRLLAQEGDPAPGVDPAEGRFRIGQTPAQDIFLYGAMPLMNNAGQTLFAASLNGDGITSENDIGIWRAEADGTTVLVVREGQTIDIDARPGVEDLRTVLNLKVLTFRDTDGLFDPGGLGGEDGLGSPFNDAGELAFVADFTDGTSAVLVAGSAPSECPGDLADSSGFGAPDGVIDFGDFFALSFLAGPCGAGTSNPDCDGDLADSSGFGASDGVIDFGDFFALSFLAGPCP